MPLKKLIVENFQSISERTEFDLNKLVLLFGPNSAGKSIIEDALTFIFEQLAWPNHELSKLDSVQFRDALSGRDSSLSKNWRRKGTSYEEFCFVGLAGAYDSNHESLWYGVPEDEVESFDWRWEVKWIRDGDSSQDGLGRPGIESMWREWSFFINDQLLISNAGVHMDHPLVTDLAQQLSMTISGPLHPRSDLALENGVLRDTGGLGIPVREGDTVRKYLMEPGWNADSFEPVIFDSEIHNYLGNIADRIDLRIKFTRSPALEPMKIGDSRTIPTPSDLSFLFHDLMQSETCLLGNTVALPLANERSHVTSDYISYPQGMNLKNTDLYRELASGYFFKLPDLWLEEEEMFEYRHWFDRVNDCLANFLFIDNGYQLDGEHAYVLSSGELDALAERGKEYRENLSAQVAITLMLRDSQGQKLHFNEVGSGVGYILPILISLVSDCNIFNKQPELHLHPALQSQLGDLYLQAATRDRYMIVETHSEHLLLRVLRRIRQRSSNRLDEEDYRFATPADVSIYYFEPQGDGETKVRPIRISPDGDFLDPWPGGFFEERYEDLFDE